MKKIETDIREYIRPMAKFVTVGTLSDTMDGDDWTISAGDDDNRANYFNAWDDMLL